uniref:uncharacterized protein isoform X6 n=1 Tax=Pristiophorus japonicus TaxID=55135 RepID=UPI00398F6DDB
MFHCDYCDLWTTCVDELDIHILETHADFQSSVTPLEKSSDPIFPLWSCSDLQSTQPDVQTSVNPGQDLTFWNESAFSEDLIPGSHSNQSLDHLQITGEYCHDQYGYKTLKENMNAFCETIGKLGTLEDSNKQITIGKSNLSTDAKLTSEQVMDVCSTAHDNEGNKPWFSTKKSELDHLLKDTINVASYFESASAEELGIKDLGHTKPNETILEVTKESELSEDLFFLVASDGAQNNTSKQINPDKLTKDGTELQVDGKPEMETGNMSCMWCGYYTCNKQCFEDHAKELHSDFEFGKEAATSTMGLQCLGCGENYLNSQVHSINYSLKRETIVRERQPIRPECENPVGKNITDDIPKIDGCKLSENMSQEFVLHPTFGPQNMRRTLKLKRQTVLYIKRLCLFHCIICPFHTLYRRCVLRHVRNVHLHPSRSRKRKRCASFSSGLKILKLCKRQCTSKKLTLDSSMLSLERNCSTTLIPDIDIRSENVNLAPSIAKPLFCPSKLNITESNNSSSKQHINSDCEALLVQQINDQLQFSVPCLLVNDSDVNASSEMSEETIGAPSCFSTLMTLDKEANDGGLNIKGAPPSSKCLALEAIVKTLKSRLASPIKCRPAVAILNDRSTKPRRSIPYCRTTEEQQAEWVMEAYSFLNQQKIERAAEFSMCDDDCLLDAIAEIEVVLSDTDDDKRTYSQAYRNNTLYGKLAKLTEDKSKILCPTSSAKKESGNVCTFMYKCDICPFSSTNIMFVLSHYHRQHPEENISCNRIWKYSRKMNMSSEMDLPLSMHTMFSFDSESADPAVPCFGGSSELCFCEHCSYSGDWVSLFEHYQTAHRSIKVGKNCNQKESERKIVNNLQVRAPQGSTSTSSSELQAVFQCQIPGNEVSSREQDTSVKEEYSESTVKRSTAVEGYRCRHCARLFKALAGLRNHEKTHFLPKTCHHPATKSSKKNKSSLKNGIQTASSEGKSYRCPRCSYSTPLIGQLRSHSLKVHGRFLMPKLRAAVSDAQKTEGYVYQALNENVFLEFPHSDCQECVVQSSGSGIEALKSLPKPAKVKNYACEFCKFTTCQFQNVKSHYRKVHRENLYFECRKCCFFSGKKNALSQHAEVCELTVSDQSCSTRKMDKDTFEENCGMTGSENENTLLVKEDFGLASTEEKSGVLHCPVCLYYTKHKSRLINHILEHKNGKMAYMKECQLELLHFFPGKVFCCDWCTFITLSQDSLIHHMDTHSPVKPYKCRLCFFEAILQTELETHLQEQHKVKCNFDLVGEVNLNEADLAVEIEEFQRKRLKSHGEKKRIQSCIRRRRSTKAIRFPCEFCGRRFLDPSEWIGHVQRHSQTGS